MKRSPMKRGKPMARGTKRINPMSEKQQEKNTRRRTIPMKDYCEAHRAGMPGTCYGPLTKHEVLPRGRGGSITDPDNIKTVCAEGNRMLSQDVDSMRWGHEHSFLGHAWDD